MTLILLHSKKLCCYQEQETSRHNQHTQINERIPCSKAEVSLRKKNHNRIKKTSKLWFSPRNHKFSNRFYFGGRVVFMKSGALRTMCSEGGDSPECSHKEGTMGPGMEGPPGPGRTIALSCTNKAALSEAQEHRNRRVPCRNGTAHPGQEHRERRERCTGTPTGFWVGKWVRRGIWIMFGSPLCFNEGNSIPTPLSTFRENGLSKRLVSGRTR